MSEPVQIVLGILFLAGIFVLTRYLVAWQIKRATGKIIGDLQRHEAVDPITAVDLPYAKENPMRIGIAADHGGFELKERLVEVLKSLGYEVVDFGAPEYAPQDDYPDYVIPLARAVARGEVERGLAVCGSGVGACVAANKVPGVRAGLINEVFSAHQGVEDDDMNVMCLGGRVTCYALAWDLTLTFLKARFKGEERFRRRLAKVAQLEQSG